jgi:hypothetical protein
MARQPSMSPKALKLHRLARNRRAPIQVGYWHFSDIPPALTNVRYRG